MWLVEITCSKCQETKKEMVGAFDCDRTICKDCQQAAELSKEEDHIWHLRGLEVEARVERIERLLYQLAVKDKLGWQMKEIVLNVEGE
jgi:peptide subunit release factor 1 (eRF1)